MIVKLFLSFCILNLFNILGNAQTLKPNTLSVQRENIFIKNSDESSDFEIINRGKSVKLNWNVLIEQKDELGNWKLLYTSPAALDILLIGKCSESPSRIFSKGKIIYQPNCRTLKRGQRLKVKAWTGWICNAQCFPHGCLSDKYLGPKTFRFVVKSCDRKRKFYGKEFTLPSQPKTNFN